jgi:hypothetical protein
MSSLSWDICHHRESVSCVEVKFGIKDLQNYCIISFAYIFALHF